MSFRTLSKQGGFSTMMTVSLVMVASVAFTLSGYLITNNMSDQVSGKKDFEMDRSIASGLNQYLIKLTQEYYVRTVSPKIEELAQIAEEKLTERLALEKDDQEKSLYKLANFKIELAWSMEQSLVASSAFRGMMAPQTVLKASYQVLKPSAFLGGGDIKVDVSQFLSVSQVGMFKFISFDGIFNGGGSVASHLEVKGRVHTNVNFCAGNEPIWDPAYYDVITAAGRVLLNSQPGCLFNKKRTANFFVNFVDKFEPGAVGAPVPLDKFKQVLETASHGCRNCEGSGKDWAEYALDAWKGHLLDSSHNVPVLSLPVAQTAAVQAGQWGKVGTIAEEIKGASNFPKEGCTPDQRCSPVGNIRILIDPVRNTDSKELKLFKVSYNSDIRIIDGVWYMRDKTDNDNWPGIPIWSDHPGDFMQDGINVGQNQIRNRMQGKAQEWPANKVPKRFSIYRYELQASGEWGISDTNEVGVISYGALKKVAASTADQPWEPGHYIESPAEGRLLCNPKGVTTKVLATPCAGGKCGFISALSGGLECKGPDAAEPMPYSTQILNATRSGFISPNLRYGTKPGPGTSMPGCAQPIEDDTRLARSRLMPMNINMRAFYEAMTDTTPGELGSYFSGGKSFNGLIYVANRWANANTPNSLTHGFTTDPDNTSLVPEWTPHGSFADATQIPATGPESQESLPFPLCSSSLAGQNFDSQGSFKIPSCATYVPGIGTNFNYINQIRVYNGKGLDDLDPTKGRIFGKGLSIGSSQSITVMGSWNADSAPADRSTNSAAHEPWLPTMIAADTYRLLSSGWSDERARWTYKNETAHNFCQSPDIPNPLEIARPAEASRWVASFVGQSLEEEENWDGKEREVIGAQARSHFAVYQRSEPPGKSNYNDKFIWVYSQPARIAQYDPHLDYVQPPGTPSFQVVSPIKRKIK